MDISCIIIDDEPHAIAEIKDLIAITPDISVKAAFDNIGDALAFLRSSGKVEVIFCDISMPQIDGLEAAGILREFCNYLIYITAHRFHGAEAFEVQAAGYLVKPLKYDKFIRQIQKIRDNISTALWQTSEDQTIFVKGNDKNSLVPINVHEIIYIQGLDNYIKIHTTEGEKITYMQLKDLDATLMRQSKYMRVAKSIIISVKFLEKVDGYVVYMKTGETFNIGKVYRPAFKEFLLQRRLN
ncbi:LytTR family DNA-binding domain-containing protein [Pedobacter agri]|uniref:LytR/AlgR family response regulator transcription factor n=1 Tax=Pedobacter agri TaxID=454586 RepID=UPI00292F79F2|nr:LytTR family DNA-binding domain-containing protein [Pedobacter agri]